MIELRNISKSFDAPKKGGLFHSARKNETESDNSEQQSYVLKNVSLTLEEGDVYGIIGVSGAGKSTLARIVNLLERPTSGKVFIDGLDVTNYDGKQLLELRSRIGIVFQDFNLFQQRSVLQNVCFPLELRNDSKQHRLERGRELLELVGLADKENSYPSQLSGGQQQRVSIARALANRPKYLLWDEATSALDTMTTNSILRLLKEINESLSVTVLVITHEMSVIRKVCNKVAVIDQGRIVESGSVVDIFSQPKKDITKELLAEVMMHA